MKSIFRLNFTIGLGAFSLSVLLLALDITFMKTWFYIFAWWPIIFILDSLNFRINGSSPLSDSPNKFFFTAFISIPVWLIFELFNLRLQNWSYHNLPQELPLRWLGYCLAFATVIPALLELSILLRSAFKNKRIFTFSVKLTPGLLNGSLVLGFLFLVFSLVWPEFFFPLVWLGFIFLLEPVNFRLKNESLLSDLERRYGIRIVSWILAGLAAGLLWETLNFWADSHWEYTIPYFGFWKIMQMPAMGFGGFLPFALEVFAMYALLDMLRKKTQGKRALKTVLFGSIIVFDVFAFTLMDMFTLVR